MTGAKHTSAKHTSPAVAELVDGDASHEQHQGLPLPHREMPLQHEPHQQCYHQNLQGIRHWNLEDVGRRGTAGASLVYLEGNPMVSNNFTSAMRLQRLLSK